MLNRTAYMISDKMIVFYFKKLIFCFAAIAFVITIGTLFLFVLCEGNRY